MALGSWQGLYNAVIEELMSEDREQELLLLMAIARFADPLGFCYPGKARLMKMRHIGEKLYNQRLTFLEKRCLVKVEEHYDYFRRQRYWLFQVSPRVLYVREEFQEYLEKVFDGVEERNVSLEMWLTQNNFGSTDSQPETEPDTEPDARTRHRIQIQNQTQNQRGTTLLQTQGNASTMRSNQREAQPTARSATDRDSAQKKEGPTGGGSDEFDALLHVDDDRLIQEIKHVVTTTDHQARAAVQTYPRDAIIHWLRIAAHRRRKGELSNPAGWFFNMLKTQVRPIEAAMPNGQTYQDFEKDNPGYFEEI